MIDIVMPDGNEKELAEMALRLGYSKICFVYENPPHKIDVTIPHHIGVISSKGSENGIINIVRTDDGRKAFERLKCDAVIGLEGQNRADFMHHRNSGLNQVLCRLAKEKNKAVVYSINDILNTRSIHRIFGRISQNIKLCRKFGVRQLITSFARKPLEMRSPKDIASLFELLGMHPKEAREALDMPEKIISENLRRRDPNHVAEGVYYLGSKQ